MLYADFRNALYILSVLKRFVRNIILFVPLAVLFTLLLIILLGGTKGLRNVTYHLGHEDHLYTKVHECLDVQDVDVLFFGSSHAYRTFDPRVFAAHGVRIFNMGSSMQTPLQTEVLISNYLDTIKPRLVVLEVHPDVMPHDGVEPAIYQLCNVPPTWDMVPMALRTRNMRVVATAAYALVHNSISPEFKHLVEPEVVGKDHYVKGGYVERDMECYSPVPHTPKAIVPREVQLKALRRCTELLKQHGVPYILLEVPDTKVLYSSYTNIPYFEETMGVYGKYYFISVDALDDSLHFFNEDHLNQRGVELYDAYLCDSLIVPILNSL